MRGCEVASGDLTAADRRALGGHVQRAGGSSAGDSGARDQVVFEFDIETDAGDRRLEFDEMSVPDDLVSLVERLQKRSRPMPP